MVILALTLQMAFHVLAAPWHCPAYRALLQTKVWSEWPIQMRVLGFLFSHSSLFV